MVRQDSSLHPEHASHAAASKRRIANLRNHHDQDRAPMHGPLTVYPQRIPFFSVICCTYNRAQLLPRAIESLLAQTESDWELIVVDDGSTDSTAALVHGYAQHHPNIRYLFHGNRGLGASRNAGVLAACGLYVTFLDSDDEYLPEHLSIRRRACVSRPDLLFIHGGLEIVGDPTVPDKNDPTRRVHLDHCAVGGSFVLRREMVIDIGGFALLRYADDAEFYERATELGVPIARIDAPTYRYYRDTPDSLCNTISTQGD